MKDKKPKIALIHDFLIYPGGAESVLKVISDLYPEAPIYTLLYDKDRMKGMFEGKDIRPSYLQKLPSFFRRHHQWLLPFFPVAPETFDLREYDLVISSTGAWSKGIVTKLHTLHISYVHSPMRFIWDYNETYFRDKKKKPSFLTRAVLNYLRIWDRLAADRPDFMIANSEYTQRRIGKYYRRDSTVIYPPVNNNQKVTINNQKNFSLDKAERLMPEKPGGYFLVVSRLSAYKKVDMVVEAFNKLGMPLVIIGQGEQENYLRKIAGPNVKILGWQSDEVIKKYYEKALAFVFPVEDDFGITVVEAMSFGVPVIAYRKGGVLETVEEGVAGEFFDAQTPEVLADGVRRFLDNEKSYDREVIKKRAEEFSRDRFENNIREFVNNVLEKNNI